MNYWKINTMLNGDNRIGIKSSNKQQIIENCKICQLSRVDINNPARCRRIAEWRCISNKQRILKAQSIGVGKFYIRNDQLPSCNTFIEPSKLHTHGSAFICGPTGTGKTWALCCIACDALASGYTVRLVNWQWLQLEIRDTYKPAATETELTVLKRYTAPDILCLDDLGAGKEIEGRESEAARVLLYTLIDYRYNNCLRTYISSNLNPFELAERYDERIARRINEMCKIVVLKNSINNK